MNACPSCPSLRSLHEVLLFRGVIVARVVNRTTVVCSTNDRHGAFIHRGLLLERRPPHPALPSALKRKDSKVTNMKKLFCRSLTLSLTHSLTRSPTELHYPIVYPFRGKAAKKEMNKPITTRRTQLDIGGPVEVAFFSAGCLLACLHTDLHRVCYMLAKNWKDFMWTRKGD